MQDGSYGPNGVKSTLSPALDRNVEILLPAQRWRKLIEEVLVDHPGVTPESVMGPCKLRSVVRAKRDVIHRLYAAADHMTMRKVAQILRISDSTVSDVIRRRPRTRK